MRFGSAAICAIFLGLGTASPAAATTVIYSVTGTGEARIYSNRREFLPDGDVIDTGETTFEGTGDFTSIYRIDLSNLPANTAGADYLSEYYSLRGSPNFLRSRTVALIDGQHFGISTDGFNYSVVTDGRDFPTFSVDSLGATGPLHGSVGFTYYASGTLQSETRIDQYNQLTDFSGGSFVSDGIFLPGFNRGGSQQMVFSETTYFFAENGTMAAFENRSRTFLGNGSVTISTLTGAVPEPQSWALMLVGFGLVGGMVRRRGEANLSPLANAA
jgi:PEP-CTERM motif